MLEYQPRMAISCEDKASKQCHFKLASAFDAPITLWEGIAYALMGSFGIGASFLCVKRFMLLLKTPAPALITYQLGLDIIILLPAIDTHQISRIDQDLYAPIRCAR